MKKLIILILLVPCLVFAGSIQDKHKSVIARQGASGADCPVRANLGYWDGDHTTSNLRGCFDSAEINGTLTDALIGTDYGESSIGIRIAAGAADQRLLFSIASGDFPETAAGTLYMRVRVATDGSTYDSTIFEAIDADDANNRMYVRVEDNDKIRVYWTGNSTADNYTGTGDITRDGLTWQTIGASWQIDTGNDLAVTVDGGSTWTETDADIVSMTTVIDVIVLGNYYLYATDSDQIDIDKAEIISGWKAANPW